jgi:lysophospholipase L1-like esterase
VVAVLAGLLLLEGGLRLLLGNFGQSHVLTRSDDPAICLELRPGADVTYTGWLLRVPPTRMRVNQLGGRGEEVPPKTPGRLRIATFGDSFTFGQGVEETESWPAAVANALNEHGVDVEILNFGVPGHGTPQSVALAERLIPRIQPDVVLVGVFTNDLSPTDSYCDYGKGDSTVARWMLQNVYIGRLAWILSTPLRGGSIPEGAESPADRFRAALTDLHAAGREGGFLTAAVLLSDRDAYAAQPWCDGCTPAHDLLAGVGVHKIGRAHV